MTIWSRQMAVASLVLASVSSTGRQLEARPQAGSAPVSIDVQVVDNKGVPIPKISASQFEVSIGGKRRKVLTADMRQSAGTPGGAQGEAGQPVERRVFVVAIDAASLRAETTNTLAAAVRTFVAGLNPADLVGLFTFPIGPKLDPTADHPAVLSALEQVIGQRDSSDQSIFRANAAATPPPVPQTEGSDTPEAMAAGPGCPDLTCGGRSLENEAEATRNLGMLRDMVTRLGQTEGRRTVVLASGGWESTDATEGLARAVAQDAGRTGTLVYALYAEGRAGSAAAAAAQGGGGDPLAFAPRFSEPLERISGGSGGAMIRLSGGNSHRDAFARILNETSAYYVLTIEPDPTDRDGRPRELRIRVNQRGSTVRGRSWLVLQ